MTSAIEKMLVHSRERRFARADVSALVQAYGAASAGQDADVVHLAIAAWAAVYAHRVELDGRGNPLAPDRYAVAEAMWNTIRCAVLAISLESEH